MNTNEKLRLLREKMTERNIDAYFIPTGDPHLSEYTDEHYAGRAFISGFTGSAGSVVVTQSEAGLWTDGRYFLQAEKQLTGSEMELFRMGEKNVPSISEFLAKKLAKGGVLGFDGKTVSTKTANLLRSALSEVNFESNIDLVGEIWQNRPAPTKTEAFVLGEEFTGESAKSKIQKVRNTLKSLEANSTIIGALEDVCYLFNLRAHDVHCNPVLTSYAFVDDEKAILFASSSELPDEVQKYLAREGVEIREYEEIFEAAKTASGTIYLDEQRINFALFNSIKTKIKTGRNITTDMKAVKNPTEIDCFRKTMLSDGVALVKLMKWLKDNVENGIDEIDIAEKLHSFRKEEELFLEDSFDTIAGYKENGAIVHYHAEKESAAKIRAGGMVLIDSGGQYLTGTTDVTRTVPLGELSKEEKENYTLVVKSHADLAMARFKEGVTGYALDTLARAPFWSRAKDFNHGTGHGVGFVLCVHEGPQSISQRYNDVALKEGMITSNEPGIYIKDSHGIRIESLVLTKKYKESEHGTFFEFETLTLAPIHTDGVLKEMLSKEERAWLNAYNEKVYTSLSPKLDYEHREFLREVCKAI